MPRARTRTAPACGGSLAVRPTRVRVPAAGVPADARHAADLDEKMGLETTSLLCVPVYSRAGAFLGVVQARPVGKLVEALAASPLAQPGSPAQPNVRPSSGRRRQAPQSAQSH